MRYLVLATDYDGTLARHGHVDDAVWAAVRRLRESGRRVVLVTGRELEDLQTVCPHLELFDRVVAENGALIYQPSTKEVRLLAEAPPPEFAVALKAHGVTPLSAGHVIVATVRPHETTVLRTISEIGLELQVIFNQEAVMVLPSGVNKATGLVAALKELGLSPHNAVSIGDAENDHALLSACECAAAVGDAVPALQSRADWVARGGAGASVLELAEGLLADDLASVGERLTRHHIQLGRNPDGADEKFDPYGRSILVTGTSGSGKSVLAAGLLERLADAKYQYAVIDPEGDFATLPGAVVLGAPDRPASTSEAINLLASGRGAVINLVGVPHADRPGFFNELLTRLSELRARTGRPHWLVVSKAHLLMPTTWAPPARRLHNLILVTVHPASVARPILDGVDLVLTLGEHPDRALAEFGTARGQPVLAAGAELADGEALAYRVSSGRPPFKLTVGTGRAERRMQKRKYAEGRLPDERTFVFRGPKGKLNLRAYNLMTFLELAGGVDDETWLHHLTGGEYSKWFRDAIKDEELARDVAAAEAKYTKDPAAGREAVRKAVEQRYTLPAITPGSGS